MRASLMCCIIAGVNWSCCQVCFAAPDAQSGEQSSASAQSEVPALSIIEDSRNQIMKFTDTGVEPRELRIRAADSILFFLNDTSDSLTTVEVEFGDRSTHCASSNMKIEDAGTIRSNKPFGPKNFATTCFHDRGTYPVTVYGLKSKNSKDVASIIVE